jgi:hypothetical protein
LFDLRPHPPGREYDPGEILIDGLWPAIRLSSGALFEEVDILITVGRAVLFRCLGALRVCLSQDRRWVERLKDLLGGCPGDFLVDENKGGRAHENNDNYEAVMDLSHPRTSVLYG